MARSFDGSGDNIDSTVSQVSDSVTLISVSFWLWRTNGGEGGYGFVFSYGDDAASNWQPWLAVFNDNGDAGWGMRIDSHYANRERVHSFAYPTNGVWTHYVITYDHTNKDNTPVVYKNGASDSVTSRFDGAATFDVSGTDVTLGDSGKLLTNCWNGKIAEFAMWNRILTAGEALGLGKGFSPRFYPNGLFFYEPLIGRASPEIELAQGASGTLTNTAVADHPSVIYPAEFRDRRFTTAAGAATSVKDIIQSGVIPFAR